MLKTFRALLSHVENSDWRTSMGNHIYAIYEYADDFVGATADEETACEIVDYLNSCKDGIDPRLRDLFHIENTYSYEEIPLLASTADVEQRHEHDASFMGRYIGYTDAEIEACMRLLGRDA